MQHFIKNATHAVYITLEVDLSSSLESLRGQVQRRSQKRLSVVLLIVELLCESEINKCDVSPRINHYIFRFEVAVDDLMLVKVLYGVYQFCENGECLFRFEWAKIFDVLAWIMEKVLRSPVGMYSRAMYKFYGV